MLKKPKECIGCPLEHLGTGFSLPGGSGKNGILLVGEALGVDEVSTGTQFVGSAGKTLNRIIEQAIDPLTGNNLKREDFKTYNVIQCRPPENLLVGQPYEQGAIEHCRPNLEKTLRDFKPKAIVPLGNTAFRWFTGNSGIDSLRGYVYDTVWGPVVPTYHPSYIQRGFWRLARVVQLDILKALRIAREGPSCFKKEKHYELHPSPATALRFLDEYRNSRGSPLAFDIETPYGGLGKDELMGEGVTTEDDPSYTIERISFAFKPYEAITVPWSPPYIDFAKAILREPGMKLVWNEAFDVPRLMANGVFFGGTICDVMHAWHFLEPSLPMGLKYVSTFLCVTPDTPILTKDLQWIDAGILKRGDDLFTFDEKTQKGHIGRCYKSGKITRSVRSKAYVFEVHLSDGTSVKTTAEHPWLTPRKTGYFWTQTKDLIPGTKLRRTIPLWKENTSRDAGWLAGIFDGEGHISFVKGTLKLGVAQNDNCVLSKTKELLDEYGFNYSEFKVLKCHRLQITGGVTEYMRLLGTLRPMRLLNKCIPEKFGELRSRIHTEIDVIKVVPLGKQEIQQISTTSKTYFASGFPMHNCPDMPAWKLMSREEPEWYSAADSDTLLRCFQHIKTALSKQDRWAQFERHFLSLKVLLNKMTLRGITVDQEKRRMEYAKLEAKFNLKVAELQTIIPPEVLPFSPKRGFKKDEEQLRKIGSWEEGRMVLKVFTLTEEEALKDAEKLAKKEKKAMQKEEKRLQREMRKEERLRVKEEKKRLKDAKRADGVRRVRRADKDFRVVEREEI